MNNKKIKRMMHKTAIFAVLVCLFGFFDVQAAFEDLEIGGKAASMAGSFVAQTDDITGIFYNPAGLVNIKRPEIFASYERMYWGLTDNSDINKQVLSFGIPFKFGSIGVGWNSLSLNNLYNESTIKFDYGFPIGKKIYMGVGVSSLKLRYGETDYTEINTVFDNGYTKSGIGADFGAIYKGEWVNLGLSVLNINEPDVGLKYSNKVPRKISLGACIKQRVLNLNIAGVLIENNYRIKTGVETWVFSRNIAVRGGLNIGSSKYRNAAVGLGYRDSWYEIDYSYTYPLSGISNMYGSHQLSFIYRYGEPEEKEEQFTWKDLVNIAKKEEEKEEEEEEEEKEITAEDIAKAQDLVVEGKKDFADGSYEQGLEKFRQAKDILPDDPEIARLIKKGRNVTKLFDNVKGRGKRDYLLRKGINGYMTGSGKVALNSLRYAYQLWPGDDKIAGILDLVVDVFPEVVESEKLVPGIDLISQKLQQALELIYDGKYVSAISTCRDILELEPRNVMALMRMGSAYWAIGHTGKAREVWRRALRLDPDNEQLLKFLKKEEKTAPPKKEKVEVEQTDEKTLKEYENAVNYYKRVKRYGAEKSTLKNVLLRMIDKFKDKNIDISYLYEELEKYE